MKSPTEPAPVPASSPGPAAPGRRREQVDKAALWVLFALLFFAFTYVHQKHFDSPTPVSRLNLLHALWQHGTFRIDAYLT